MATASELCELGLGYHRNGDLAAAEQLYRQILQADPNHADANHLMGVLAYQAGRQDVACQLIQRAIYLNPLIASYHSNLGLVLEALGQPENAFASYQEALRLAPGDRAAFDNMAALLIKQRKLEEAVVACRQWISIQPNFAEAHQHLAHALYQRGQLDESAAHFLEALRLRPDFVEANNNLGNLLYDRGHTEQALAHFHTALALRPQSPEIRNNLARALHRLGKFDEAVAQYREAIRIAPNFVQAHNNLGTTFAQKRLFDEAIASYRNAIQIDPSFAEAHCNLGATLVRHGRLYEAIVACRQAIALQPRYADAHNNLAGALLEEGNLVEAAASYRIALDINPHHLTAHSNLLFCLNYDPNANPDEVFAEHRRWGERQESQSPPLVAERVKSETSRLRIGYVSPDLRQHALIRYIEPVLANHDPTRVEVYCYAEVSHVDETTKRLQKYAHHWRSTFGVPAPQAAEQIRDDRIDILVDLAGHTSGNRLDIFALKPAPVQATWLGYLNTTGLATVDYRLTDEVLDPTGQPRRDTEELLRLPQGFCCFAPPTGAPDVRGLPALQRGHITFGFLHNLFKLNSAVYDLWSDVLRALPTSRFLMYRDTLQGAALDRVVREFGQRGIGQERLELRSAPRDSDHLPHYADIDVCLDAFPWTGGVTTCESLWMGIPMLSLAGVRPPARNSASILTQVGLSDFVCATPELLVTRATRLINELEQLAELRLKLRKRMTATLCDATRFTIELENAYYTMWQRHATAARD